MFEFCGEQPYYVVYPIGDHDGEDGDFFDTRAEAIAYGEAEFGVLDVDFIIRRC